MPPSGMVGTTMKKKKEPFMDVDFADYAVLLAEMLSVLVWALEAMDMEACPRWLDYYLGQDQNLESEQMGWDIPVVACHSSR